MIRKIFQAQKSLPSAHCTSVDLYLRKFFHSRQKLIAAWLIQKGHLYHNHLLLYHKSSIKSGRRHCNSRRCRAQIKHFPHGLFYVSLFDSEHSKGGLLREWGLFRKLDEKDIYDSFISLLPHILQFQHTILRVEYIYLTEFYSQTVPKLTCKRSLSYIN